MNASSIDSSIGALTLLWQQDKQLLIVRILLPGQETPLEAKPLPEDFAELAAALQRLCRGEDTAFEPSQLCWDGVSPFARQVLETLRKVPMGKVISYGGLAKMAGFPGAARATGRVLAANPFPLLYPCHRVISSSGALHGFGGGLALKKHLLEIESMGQK